MDNGKERKMKNTVLLRICRLPVLCALTRVLSDGHWHTCHGATYPSPSPVRRNSSDVGDSHKWPWSGLGGPDPWTPHPEPPLGRGTGTMRNAENRARVKCGMLHAEKYCGMKGKMRNVKNAQR